MAKEEINVKQNPPKGGFLLTKYKKQSILPLESLKQKEEKMSVIIPPFPFDEKMIQERNEVEREVLTKMLTEMDNLFIAELRVIPKALRCISFGSFFVVIGIFMFMLL
ncbi:MAG: hypothetical protein WCT49_01625 [Candidatus Paceibacterota bacterium]|nr:hypothetical protein [Candidatus Paceibacterota bacterium]